jgi:hypothetical protein
VEALGALELLAFPPLSAVGRLLVHALGLKLHFKTFKIKYFGLKTLSK